ncbi:DUF3073 domain-containing protein [Gulosibacter sp. ACHW.36C]|uniref:DUF3073 domain-containing protein n=1 Tax=Gulosibacter sediminis TaxID=1729695 RepID=A0ABY4MYA0_9MICO|nr:DUF3073 domain-containing protein [Gulosibacter sediminis]UQN15004.1 DUF3073 domain-containing protein [Gulosibacter sediminis]
MGRGRQKAKHTKVARELKYNIPETDYESLQRELHGNHHEPVVTPSDESEEDELSKWAEYIDDDREYEAGDDLDQRRRA